MDRMDQTDRATFAAGHVAMPANCPSAVTPSKPRAACALMASSSRRKGSADSDDAGPAPTIASIAAAVPFTGLVIPASKDRIARQSIANWSLNSCHLEISGERRSAVAALLDTLPEQEPSKMRQVMRNVTLCLIATWIAISALTSSAQAATFGSSAWWQQMDSDGRGGRGG